MIIYLAGKMAGLPDYGRKRFNEAEKRLAKQGNVVLNPACLPIGLRSGSYMQIGLAMLDAADAIYLLDGWRDSRGASLELAYAQYQGKTVIMEEAET